MNINSAIQPPLRTLFLLVWFSLFTFFSQLSIAAPDSSVQVFWSVSNESSTRIIEHNDWQTLLDIYLDDEHPSGINRFDYAVVSSEDRKKLSHYLQQMQQLNPRTFNQAEQKAYWINLYNALTVEAILKNYPVESITKLGDSIFSFGPWDDKVVNIQGHESSLNDIEHGILRPLFNDNRIHYAVNCASISCPNLSASAYTSTNTHSLLEQAAHQYVNHPRGVTFENEKLNVSSIYHWYKDDFGQSDQALITHLIQYAEPDLEKQLRHYLLNPKGGIDNHYNWDLNQP